MAKHKHPNKKTIIKKKPSWQEKIQNRNIYSFLARFFIFVLLIAGAVVYTDYKGIFDPDDTNDHSKRKWNSYYQFTKKQEVDIVMVGNSHLYTGINPKHLSSALGANCFILAAPGTTLTDAYYCLKEAIDVKKPKIAIVETYTIDDYDSHQLPESKLSDQIQSFRARKNVTDKLWSTPRLFTSGFYLAAWSNTVRNHRFIFTDTARIRKNLKPAPAKKEEKLYLGRFVSFTSGIQDTTLLKYDVPGSVSVVDGSEWSAGPEAEKYLGKIVRLCKENDIELVLLTLPVYHRHVTHYDTWKSGLNGMIAPYDLPWLDLQSPYDKDAFTPECFENTVKANQHLTYYGSLVSTYKLAHFIRDRFPDLLEDRSQDPAWNRLFYAEEGYFENHTPENNDTVNVRLFENVNMRDVNIREISVITREKDKQVLIKIAKENHPGLSGKKLKMLMDVDVAGQYVTALIEAQTTPALDPPDHYLYVTAIRKDVNIRALRDMVFEDSDT